MRIGVNTLFLIPKEVGGSEAHLRGLLPAIQALDSSIEFVVFTNHENHETFSAFERVLIGVHAHSRPKRVLAEQFALPTAARKAGADLLFSPGYTGPVRTSCPHVLNVFDVQFLDYPEDFPWVSRQVQWQIIQRAAQAASAITTTSEFSRKRIVEGLGVPIERIHVTYSGISDAFATPNSSPLPKPFLLYVSNTYPHKNARRLTTAFARMTDTIPHNLVIVGQPRGGEPPPHPRVIRLHHVSEPELVGLYQACDLFVFPSLYEGFGRPVAEAMAAGARVAASKSASIPEVGGDAATYFDGTDEDGIVSAILEALNEPADVREQHTRAGREYVQRFSWAACARRTLEAFEVARR